MADPGSGWGGPDAASQAAGAAAASAASSSSGFSGPASTGMSDNFGMHDDSFGQQQYGGPNNLGGSTQDHVQASFNAKNQITSKNPYGKNGFFSRVLGIDPNLIDYSNNMDFSTRLSIANNQFSKFANPQNIPGQLGYNPQYATAPAGQVRSGVQKAGYETAYGPVMAQAREQSIGEMLARGAMGLFGGPVGMLMGQLGTQEYGLPGQPGFDSFDPNNPRQGGGILGAAMLGGLNTSQAADKVAQAVDSLRARFSPTLAPTANAGIGSLTPASYETRADIRNRLSSTSPTMVSAPSSNLNGVGASVPSSSTGFSRVTRQTLPDGRQIMVDEQGSPISTVPSSMKSSSLSPTAGEQLAGLNFFEKMIFENTLTDETKEIMRQKGITVDDLLAPKQQEPEAQKPNILDMIRGVTQTSALGGPATANQLAFDATGMSRYGNSYIANDYGIMDKAANSIPGLADTLRSMGIDIATPPTAKIYSPPTSSNAFSRLIGR